GRLAASCLATPGDIRPITATTRPLLLRSAAVPEARSWPRDCFITASEFSSTSSNAPEALTAPVSVTSWPPRPSCARCTPTEAAALTAYSNDEPAPLPACAPRLVSSSSVTRLRHCCSSRRTMSSPYLAVERQCTLRRSSTSREG